MRRLTDEEIARLADVRWWHRIPVGTDGGGATVYTPGEVRHGPDGGDWPTTRFGLADDLTGQTVLDVGGWDGFFSFEAEARGAADVHLVDVPPEEGGNWGGTAGFETAKGLLGSRVHCSTLNLDSDAPRSFCATGYDLVLCFGVLYHVKNPLRCIENLFLLTRPGGDCLIETARDPDDTLRPYAAWCLLPGRHGDPTNFWYPSEGGLRTALGYAGFSAMETVYDDGQRMTVRARRRADAMGLAWAELTETVERRRATGSVQTPRGKLLPAGAARQTFSALVQPQKGGLKYEVEGAVQAVTEVLYCNLTTRAGSPVRTDLRELDTILRADGRHRRVAYVADEGGQGDHLKVYLVALNAQGAATGD